MVEVGYDNKPKRYELKTAPGGYVELRRLPYDEILRRREMATTLSMEQSPGARRNSRQDRKSPSQDEPPQKIGIELVQLATREFEFAACIVDHNLTIDGVKIDFSRPKMAFKAVSPEVLQEIELILSDLNMETDEDELDDFTPVASPFSLVGEAQSIPSDTIS